MGFSKLRNDPDHRWVKATFHGEKEIISMDKHSSSR